MSTPQYFKRLSFIFNITVSITGLLVLIGWIGNIVLLKSILPNWQSMKANAAICFMLAGITVIVINRDTKSVTSKWLTAICSGIIFIIGALTLGEYIFRFSAGIDELFFTDTARGFPGIPPGRQSPTSAAYFMLFGFCYLPGIYNRIKIHLFQLIHIVSGIIVLISLMGYLLGSYIIAGTSLDFIFVIHSTVSFLLLIMAILFSQPETGYMKLVSSESTGGRIIRRAVPQFIVLFVSIGWLRLEGEKKGYYNAELGDSLFIILMIIIFSTLLIFHASSLSKAEIILKKSGEKLLKLNENLELGEKQANLGSWDFEVDSQVRTWSKQMFRLFGLVPTDKAPSNEEFLRYIHPDDRALFMNTVYQMNEEKSVPTINFRSNPQLGPIKYLLPTWQVINDAEGKPVKYFGTLQDITERIEVSEELKIKEDLISKVFHSKVFGMVIINKERKVVDINETLTNLIGYKKEDLIGKTSLEIGLTDPKYIEKRDELLQLFFKNGSIENYDLEVVTRDGRELNLLLSAEILKLNDKPHFLISLADVTEKRKAEKKLMENETRLRTILETVPECVKLIDLNGELTYMNPAGLAMLEANHFAEVEGRKGLNNINAPYLNDFYNLIANVYTGPPGKMEYEITGFKGSHKWMETIVVPLRNSENQIISLLGVTRDISERKIAEQQIKLYNDQLRQLAANLVNIREDERSRIGREIHDELGQWLTVLKMEIARVEKIKGDENSLHASIKEMLQLVDGCIKSSRKISTELRPALIDDLGLIAALEWQAGEFGKRTGIKSKFVTDLTNLEIPPDYKIAIFRIFQESLTNVARHAEASKVVSSLFIIKEDIVLKIIDNGKGFDPSSIVSTKTLGLIGMKERVLLVGGSYEIESAPGKGTEITVIIPMTVG